MKAYNKAVSYTFNVCEEELSTEGVYIWRDIESIDIEETRKNGHEDSHMSGTAIKNPKTGKWYWEDNDYNMFSEYHSDELSEGILKHLNKEDPPRR